MTEREAYWRDAIGRQSGSGLSIAAFCKREGVSTASFYNWRKRLRRQPQATEPAAPAFLPLTVTGETAPSSGGWIEVIFPQGPVVRLPEGTSRQTLATVLAAVREATC